MFYRVFFFKPDALIVTEDKFSVRDANERIFMFKPSGTSANILHAHIAHRLKTCMPRLSCRCTHESLLAVYPLVMSASFIFFLESFVLIIAIIIFHSNMDQMEINAMCALSSLKTCQCYMRSRIRREEHPEEQKIKIALSIHCIHEMGHHSTR